MKRDLIDEAIVTVLVQLEHVDGDPLECGRSDTPNDNPRVPYMILYQSPSPHPYGSMGDPEDMKYWDYAIKYVGHNHQEVTRLASQGQDIILHEELSAVGIGVVWRKTISEGVVAKSSGPDLFERNDVYRICVTPTP